MSDPIRSRRGGAPSTPNEPKLAPTLEECLLDLQDLIEHARSMPMSASVLVSRDDVLGIIDEAMRGLPEEIQRARWLIKERDQFLVEARRDANLIIESARAQAERMVERIEIVREARRVADQMVFDAESDARRLRNEAEDYVAGQLLKFEETLEDILAVTRRGRSRFALQKEVEEEVEEDQDFFDQDYLDDE
ncbi:MAG: hypothetical protein JHD17_02080 [Acidimicrobiia bacterium]|nr:hypothetical protein [Acidimicrobiia bacterium]